MIIVIITIMHFQRHQDMKWVRGIRRWPSLPQPCLVCFNCDMGGVNVGAAEVIQHTTSYKSNVCAIHS